MASTKTNQDILFEFFFNKLDNGKAGCKSCGRHLVTLGGNSTGLVRHLDLNHKAMMATFEEKKKQRDETKNGGAYFSAIFGRKFDLTTVLRSC